MASTICGSSYDHHKPLIYIRTPYTGKHDTNQIHYYIYSYTLSCILPVNNYKSPLSIQPANSVSRAQLNLSCLIPYIKKGREMRIERSVMYKTPRKSDLVDVYSIDVRLESRNLINIRQHLFSRDSISSHDDICLSEESMNLTGNV